MARVTDNSKSSRSAVCRWIGSSNHSETERQAVDFYATPRIATESLLKIETFQRKIWEPACGDGAIARILRDAGHDVLATDKYPRGYGREKAFDFLTDQLDEAWNGDIVTNPPFRDAELFVRRALQTVRQGAKVTMLLRLQFLESRKRALLFESDPPIRVWVSSARLSCMMDGDEGAVKGGGTIAFAWFVWVKGFQGKPEIGWFNRG